MSEQNDDLKQYGWPEINEYGELCDKSLLDMKRRMDEIEREKHLCITRTLEVLKTLQVARQHAKIWIDVWEKDLNSEVDIRYSLSCIDSAMDGFITKLINMGVPKKTVENIIFGGRRFKQ